MGKRTITVVAACVKAGKPALVLNEVTTDQARIEEGYHIRVTRNKLEREGYEAPFLMWDEHDAPPFLIPGIRAHLNILSGDARQR